MAFQKVNPANAPPRSTRPIPPPRSRIWRPIGTPAPRPSFDDWQRLASAQHAIRASQQIPPATPEMIRAAKLYRLAYRSPVIGERAAASSKLNQILSKCGFTLDGVAAFAATEAQQLTKFPEELP